MSNYITIDLDGKIIKIEKERYVRAKTKDLREFGYEGLGIDEVEAQLDKVLAGEELNIIGMFIEKDIVKPQP